MRNSIRFLSLEDVVSCGGTDINLAARDIKRGFELLLKGDVLQPHKTTLKVKKQGIESETGLVNFLPAYVNLDGEEIYGCKGLGAMPANVDEGMPRALGLITLYDSRTKSPLCVMDAQAISATRTGAVTKLAASKLVYNGVEEVGLVGSGVNMKTQLLGLSEALPNLKRARVYSRSDKKIEFARQMSKRTGLIITPVNSAEEAVRDCELTVTCLPNVCEPVVKAEWIKERGITMINIGCYESEARVLSRMDRVIADMWAQGKHRGVQTHAIAVKKGYITEDKVEDLAPILAGEKPGRLSRDENIFFAPTGLGFEDMVVAWRVYREAEERCVGQVLTLWESPSWI